MKILEKNSSQTEQTILNELYRPLDLENFVGNETLKSSIQKQLNQNDIQNYLFYGPSGTGKTTLAKIIVNTLNCDSIYINASDERGIETIRDKVKSFASMSSFHPLKVVILDEADFLTIMAQASLRNLIEEFSRSTRFILTCNYIEKIIDPIQSRCQTLKLIPPSKVEVGRRLFNICQDEGIKYKISDFNKIVNQYYPDMRKMINTIQSSIIDGKMELDPSIFISQNYMFEVLKELQLKKPHLMKIRQIIADSNVIDFEMFYRFLFDKATEYLPGQEGTVAILINEHLYQSQFRIDKEINLISCLQNIINNK